MLDVLDRAMALRALPMFVSLSDHEIVQLAEVCATVALRAGQSIRRAGEPGGPLFVVARGGLRLERAGTVLAEWRPGDWITEISARGRELPGTTVTAHTTTDLVRLERDDVLDLLGDHPELVFALGEVLLASPRVSGP